MTGETKYAFLLDEIQELVKVKEGVQALLADTEQELANVRNSIPYSDGEAMYKTLKSILLQALVDDLKKVLEGEYAKDNRPADNPSSGVSGFRRVYIPRSCNRAADIQKRCGVPLEAHSEEAEPNAVQPGETDSRT